MDAWGCTQAGESQPRHALLVAAGRAWGSATAGGQEDRGLVPMHDRNPEKGVSSISAKRLSFCSALDTTARSTRPEPSRTRLCLAPSQTLPHFSYQARASHKRCGEEFGRKTIFCMHLLADHSLPPPLSLSPTLLVLNPCFKKAKLTVCLNVCIYFDQILKTSPKLTKFKHRILKHHEML
jgi:hypothetical protein